MNDRLVSRLAPSKALVSTLGGTLLVLLAGRGWAQSPPAPPAAAPAAPPPEGAPPVADESKKADAKAHFTKGLTLLREEAWAPALAEFLASREMYPTFSATNNAARALHKLQRYDESLDLYETALREFPNAGAAERTFAQRAVAELRERVGTIEITGAEPGAAIVVSGQNRGEYPSITPLRVSVGTHLVRLFKEGYEPFEARVDVAGGQMQRVPAKLQALKTSGRLKVTERSGRTLEVFVDGTSMGQTPWEGTLSVGNHAVYLRGRGRDGTQPAAAAVKAQQVTALTLKAEELDANLRVDPTPQGATVAIDGVPVGNGLWFGPLKSGAHRVEVVTDGFLPAVKDIKLERGGREILTVKLERNPDSPLWRKPSRWTVDFDAGVAVVPSFGGKVAGDCTGTCASSPGLGGLGFFHAGYQLGSGFGFGLSAGYLLAVQSVSGRTTDLVPYSTNGKPPPQSGTADDSLRMNAFLGGANLFYRLGDKVPVMFRLGAGALVGQLRDERSGKFKTSQGNAYNVDPAVTLTTAKYIYINPGVKVGVRLGDHVDLSIGAQMLVLIALSQATWNQSIEVNAGPRPTKADPTPKTDGAGTYRGDSIMGSVVLGVVPAASLRYDF